MFGLLRLMAELADYRTGHYSSDGQIRLNSGGINWDLQVQRPYRQTEGGPVVEREIAARRGYPSSEEYYRIFDRIATGQRP